MASLTTPGTSLLSSLNSTCLPSAPTTLTLVSCIRLLGAPEAGGTKLPGQRAKQKQKLKGKMVERKSIYFTDNVVSLSMFPVNFKFKGKVNLIPIFLHFFWLSYDLCGFERSQLKRSKVTCRLFLFGISFFTDK